MSENKLSSNMSIQEDVLKLRVENSIFIKGESNVLTYALNEVKFLIKKECLNCRKTFLVEPTAEQDFCGRCYSVVCRAVFDKSNSNLTCKQLVENLRGE